MAFVGYARVSTVDQNHQLQVKALRAAGCKKVYSEKKSGLSIKGRSELEKCIDYLREGDTLVVVRIDRLARSLRDLQNLVHDLKKQKINLKAIEQPIDTRSAAGKAFLDMLGVFAEFETNLRKERQMEGIEKAKAEGKYKGRKPTARSKASQVLDLIDQGYTRDDTANKLGIGVASVYRILKDYKTGNANKRFNGRSRKKIATLDVWLRVENNSKFVRGKTRSRSEIEDTCFAPYDMVKPVEDGWDYILKVPYSTDKELDDIVDELMTEAESIADLRNGFTEMSIQEQGTEKTW